MSIFYLLFPYYIGLIGKLFLLHVIFAFLRSSSAKASVSRDMTYIARIVNFPNAETTVILFSTILFSNSASRRVTNCPFQSFDEMETFQARFKRSQTCWVTIFIVTVWRCHQKHLLLKFIRRSGHFISAQIILRYYFQRKMCCITFSALLVTGMSCKTPQICNADCSILVDEILRFWSLTHKIFTIYTYRQLKNARILRRILFDGWILLHTLFSVMFLSIISPPLLCYRLAILLTVFLISSVILSNFITRYFPNALNFYRHNRSYF